MTLSELAAKYKTDKLDHGYMPFYEKLLPKNPKKILEIGVKEGFSIRMWKEYFPNAEIHGLDLFSELDPPSIPGITWHKGNQCDWLLLEKLRNENFDVIIDDGSHNSRDQMITFFGLFNGNQYYIEDIHCNYDPYFSQGLPLSFSAGHLLRRLEGAGIIVKEEKNITFIKCS